MKSGFRFFSEAISIRGSIAEKTELPATSTFAPACNNLIAFCRILANSYVFVGMFYDS